MKITHVNPNGLYKSPAFSQAIVAEGGKTIYIGGQNGILSDGFAAVQKVWGDYPTAISVVFVESLGVPGALVKIEAIAVVDA